MGDIGGERVLARCNRQARGVAHDDPGLDADGAEHRGHRGGELLAEAGFRLGQELEDRARSRPERGVDLIAELAGAVQALLDRDDPVEDVVGFPTQSSAIVRIRSSKSSGTSV